MRPEDMTNEMDQAALQDTAMMEQQMMEEAQRLDMEEDAEMTVEGEYSEMALNKVVDALNQVLKIFRAPEFPRFESGADVLPPELVRSFEMVNKAAGDAMIEDKLFDTRPTTDRELKEIAGKLSALAMDKAFKSFLNKPQGEGMIQEDMGVPTTEMSGGDTNVQRTNQPPANQEVDVNTLFASRM